MSPGYKMNRTQQTVNENSINVNDLMKTLSYLTEKITLLENCQGYDGWMTIKRAASLIGISRDALAQRIINHNYPEYIVWRQSAKGCSIMINLKALNKII